MGIKMPTLPKLSNPFQRREDGKMQFIGLTAMEWITTTVALVLLYAILAGFFAVLLIIANKIRHNGDSFERPGQVFPFRPEDD
ncbi:hypothetical protein BU14_0177s0018 [Porphyra umbilicalis]|uniref:Uncharacterized protein n=1 Tax=Porphyra umbilicalis TaxID=2786 RepID=A0A1X6P7A5_PORUM|nr:hypothetical protein BU14_0177s0018 [Porphyra umbilicalis]|eukprot:OSX76738.1 hypothetical protein BU14_0177s0018 [Porphyra umbilicalis]